MEKDFEFFYTDLKLNSSQGHQKSNAKSEFENKQKVGDLA